ncbi:MAG: SpoIIE family protein phosphatase [Clostridiales bacterium]|nr:SpoIIE family protein phosphatase [Clostridiales bacterium]
MEHTRKINTFGRAKAAMGKIVVYVLLAFLVGRVSLIDGCFPAAVAFIAFMVSRNTVNIYLIIPAAAGMVPQIMLGHDGLGDVIAAAVCGLLFVATRKMKAELWHKALLAASTYIICLSIFRIITKTVYKMDLSDLILQGALVVCFMYIFDEFFNVVQNRRAGGLPELAIAAFTIVCLMVVCGVGLGFFIWPMIIFIGLWALVYGDIGGAALVIIAAGAFAALAGQGQWGIAVTVIAGLVAASFAKKYGKVFTVCIFTAACFFLGKVESGVVLGVENLCLFPAAFLFLLGVWRFDKGLRAVSDLFFQGKSEEKTGEGDLDSLLEDRADEMVQLANMYSTYLDSRAVLSSQFYIMEQMISDLKQKVREAEKGVRRTKQEKYSVGIGVSQCAAKGTINGDHCGWQDIGNGRIAMIISDGMGKGKKAATESLMVTRTILAFLRLGVSVDMTLKMINTIMLMKDGEDSFATVDLILVNKHSGRTKFYKIGAAPTLLRRKNNVEEVKLSAVPLGIVNGLKVNYVEATLRKGDWIIMMSDGISDGGDRRGFLEEIKDTAVNIRSESPQTMCDLILNRAADSYIGRERDDLTVLAAKIE